MNLCISLFTVGYIQISRISKNIKRKGKKNEFYFAICNSPNYTAQKKVSVTSLHAHRTRVQVVHIHSCRSCCDTRMTKKIKNADLDTVRTGKCLIIIIHVLIYKLTKTSFLLQEEVREVLLDSPNEQPIFQLKSVLFPHDLGLKKNEFKYPLHFSLGYEYMPMVPHYT